METLRERLVPVEQGVDDLSQGAQSLRYVEPRTVEAPRFDRLWRLRGTDYFVRIEGAVHAVFRQSDYERTSAGVEATVPAGTVFYLEPPASLLAERMPPTFSPAPSQRTVRGKAGSASAGAEPAWVSNRVDRYLEMSVDPTVVLEAEQPSARPSAQASPLLHGAANRTATFDAESERQRTNRVGELLHLALHEPTPR